MILRRFIPLAVFVACLAVCNINTFSEEQSRDLQTSGISSSVLFTDRVYTASDNNSQPDSFQIMSDSDLLNDFRQATENFEEEINISKYNIKYSDFEALYETLVFCSPRSYYLIADNGTYQYFYPSTTYNDDGEEIIDTLFPIYQLDIYDDDYFIDPDKLTDSIRNEVEQKQELFDKTIDEITGALPDTASDFDRLLYYHNYIAEHFSYNYTDYLQPVSDRTSNNIMHFVEDKSSLCESYAMLFNYLAMSDDIPTGFVTSTDQYSNPYHTWNLVYVDLNDGCGKRWYHVDVTMDDPYPDRSGYASMKYFMISDDDMRESHDSIYVGDKYITYPELDIDFGDDLDDAAWHSSVTPLISFKDKYYYMNSDNDDSKCYLTAVDSVSSNTNSIFEFNADWGIIGALSGLTLIQDKLYFNSASALYEYDTVSGTTDEILLSDYGISIPDGYQLCSCFENNDTLYLSAASDVTASLPQYIQLGPYSPGTSTSKTPITVSTPTISDDGILSVTLSSSSDIEVTLTVRDGNDFHLKHFILNGEQTINDICVKSSKASIYIWDNNMKPYVNAINISE